ncbi:MAG: serine protease [Thermoleophilaceae bacterium]|nr:serine protease [Thermoleophilaceae bacterium]
MRFRSLLTAVTAASAVAGPVAVAHAAVVPGKVIVRYQDGATHSQRVLVQQSTGTSTDSVLPGGTRELKIRDGATVGQTLDKLRRHRSVAYAVPDYIAHAADFIPNDPGKTSFAGGWQEIQWNFTGPAGVNAPGAWDLARQAHAPGGGSGVIVAVLDSGVAYENYKGFRRAPDLYATRFVRGYDWVDRDTHPDDEESHGTHVTGTIAQKTNNGFGVTGLAYGVKIMPLRVLDRDGNGNGSDIAKAIRWATKHGAQVINMSVEFQTTETARDIPDVISAINYAEKKGVVLVAASGNEGIGKVAYPARANGVISVGATTATGCLADYSNAGRGLDLVAPGGGQDAPLDDNAYDKATCDPTAPDKRIFQETLWGDVRHFRLVGFEGTSFAAPHVTAIAALIIGTKRLGPKPTPTAVRRRIMDTARDIGPPGYDARYGAGLADATAALAP